MKPRAAAAVLLSVLTLLVLWWLLTIRTAKPSADSPQAATEAHAEPVLQQTDGQLAGVSATVSQDPREQLEAIAKSRGLPLNMLTQEALCRCQIWSKK